jgi:outer membrane immunogenic protein
VILGYDRQIRDGFVIGVFGDYAFGELDGDIDFDDNATIDNQWAVGGRIGFVRSCCTMWYVNAGYTQADLEADDAGGDLDETLEGYFVGGGVEQQIRDNLFLKLEYRFSDYDDVRFDSDEDLDTDVHSIRLGVNWKFDVVHRDHAPAPLK